jgi:hypothetical protein
MQSRKDSNSQYFEIQGNAKKPYTITINYEKGHWCTCRGMISMKSSWEDDAGKTAGTSCKHVKEIIREEFGDDWGTKNSDGSRTAKPAKPSVKRPPLAPPKPSGRRAAVMATRAKLAKEHLAQTAPAGSLLDRIAALEAAR